MCNHEMIDCPNHEGGYDCTPFCKVCEGEQGYCPICEPIESTCNCSCGCTNPLSEGTCVDCSENGDHQNNNELALELLAEMKLSGNYHNPTLDELEQRLQ
jgi:hypothetical protein